MACRFSCPLACGILISQPGIKLQSSALEGEFLTSRPPGRSLRYCFLFTFLFSDAFPITEGMPVHCRVRPNDMKLSESKAHLPVILHSLLRCGLSLCRSPPGPPTAPAPRPPSLLELRFPAPSAASPGAPGPGVPPHLSALVTVPGTQGPALSPFILTEVRLSDCLQ